jgi:hypothetical protein
LKKIKNANLIFKNKQMIKKFDEWNKLKKEIDEKSDLHFSPRV